MFSVYSIGQYVWPKVLLYICYISADVMLLQHELESYSNPRTHTPSHTHTHHHHHHHQSLNREGRWGTTDDFATSFLHFSLFSTALWDLPKSRPVHSLMLSSHLFLCPPCLLPPFTVPCKMVLARPDELETWPYHCSLRLFTIVRDLRVVHLPAGYWHGLPRW